MRGIEGEEVDVGGPACPPGDGRETLAPAGGPAIRVVPMAGQSGLKTVFGAAGVEGGAQPVRNAGFDPGPHSGRRHGINRAALSEGERWLLAGFRCGPRDADDDLDDGPDRFNRGS